MVDPSISAIEHEIMNYVVEVADLAEDAGGISKDCNLLEQQIIDSYDFLELLTFLETQWNISFTEDEQTDGSLGSITEMAVVVHHKVHNEVKARGKSFTQIKREDVTEHLERLGIRDGMKVVVHSSLLSFGSIESQTSLFIEELLAAVGASGTIAMPTFTLHLTPDDLYDPANTPSRTGALPEAFRLLPEAKRSPCPLHSYAAIGKDSEVVSTAAENRSFGKDSCLDRFVTEKFHWLFLGCGSRGEACTLSHHTEATYGVPYRRWITFPRKILTPQRKLIEIEYKYYARRDGFDARLNVTPIQEELLSNQKMTKIKAPRGYSYFTTAQDLHQTGLKLLEEEPYILTRPEPLHTSIT